MTELQMAEIKVLWIAEDKPDRFSELIMWGLKRPYSHNAFLFKDMMWHSTTPGGVTVSDIKKEMRGCHIAASIDIRLNCTERELQFFLEGESGKEYDMRANIGFVFPRVAKFMRRFKLTKWMVSNPDTSRNCSEFVGNVIHKFYKPMPGYKQDWTPAFTEEFLKPTRHV